MLVSHPIFLYIHGDSVTSVMGEYRVCKQNAEKGTHVFEMKKMEKLCTFLIRILPVIGQSVMLFI